VRGDYHLQAIGCGRGLIIHGARAVLDAQLRNSSLDVEAKADQLAKEHPEAEISRAVIEKNIARGNADAGVQPKR
jgi:hypothetical protein